MAAFLRAVWIATLFAILPLGSSPAWAHAALIRTEPADGAVLPRAPAQFRLVFNEPVSPLLVRLVTPSGMVLPVPGVAAEGSALVVTLPEARGEGSYVLSWRVASEDGHPVGGTVLFSVGTPSADLSLVDNSNPFARATVWLTRFMLITCVLFGVGGAAFGGLIAPLPRVARRVAQITLGCGLISAGISIGLQGVDALGAPLAALFDTATWRVGVATSYAITAWLLIVSILIGLLSFLRVKNNRLHVALSGAALTCVGVALAASGHASAASPKWLTTPAVFVHAVGVTFWIGSLVPLALLLRSAGSTQALARFSTLIRYAVAGLTLSGVVLGAVQLGWPNGTWLSPYGAVLLAKLVLLAGLFGLAAHNRYRLTGPVLAGDADARDRMRRSVKREIALALAILAVVALWRFTPPPRALADVAAAPAYTHIHTPAAMADITVTPGRAGAVGVSVVLQTGEFGPLVAKEVSVELSQSALGIEPIERQALRDGEGAWRIEGMTIPVAGRWQVRIEILVTDFDKVTLDGALDIGR